MAEEGIEEGTEISEFSKFSFDSNSTYEYSNVLKLNYALPDYKQLPRVLIYEHVY